MVSFAMGVGALPYGFTLTGRRAGSFASAFLGGPFVKAAF